MEKRGQVTIFIIIGLILVVVVALLLYAQNKGFQVINIIGSRELTLKDEVSKCIIELGDPALDLLARQGGSFNPKKFRLYLGYEVNYLCYNLEDTDVCSNRVLTQDDLELELENYLGSKIKSCIDSRFGNLRSSNTQIQTGQYSLDVTVARDNVLFLVKYPTTIRRSDSSNVINEYLEVVGKPLGRLYEVAYSIVRAESSIGDFDPVPYMILYKDVQIRKDRPYPDKLYSINKINDDYTFQFAVEDE